MAYSNILIAIDLTDEAEEVLAAARNIVEQQTAPQVSAVTVVRPFAQSYGGLDVAAASSGLNLETDMRKQAAAKLDNLAKEYGIDPANTTVITGSPAAEVRNHANHIGADLIVIGTHARHGFGLLLGSTANGVLHGVQCDVLVVKIHPDSD